MAGPSPAMTANGIDNDDLPALFEGSPMAERPPDLPARHGRACPGHPRRAARRSVHVQPTLTCDAGLHEAVGVRHIGKDGRVTVIPK
jgi:hypothetical protein